MRYSSTTLVFVEGTPSTVKDELLTCNGAYSLDDAVQIDAEDIDAILEDCDVSEITKSIITTALTKHNGGVFQFV